MQLAEVYWKSVCIGQRAAVHALCRRTAKKSRRVWHFGGDDRPDCRPTQMDIATFQLLKTAIIWSATTIICIHQKTWYPAILALLITPLSIGS
jgi:hypothetical protein